MNKLKWYDFVGALILLVSVTKSAIKPIVIVDQSRSLSSPAEPTVITTASRINSPREASLSQMDRTERSIEGMVSGISFSADAHNAELNTRHGLAERVRSLSTAKSLPQSAPRTEPSTVQDGAGVVILCSHTHSKVVVFIC